MRRPRSRNWPDLLIVEPARGARSLERVRRAHAEFDEASLQELLAEHPNVIPVTEFRADAGRLLCIGREVPTGSGPIDNLYLSTGGYPVLVETKLWRNPQARREVVSQAHDYVKDLANRDFAWLAERWREHARSRGLLQLAPGDGPMLTVKKRNAPCGASGRRCHRRRGASATQGDIVLPSAPLRHVSQQGNEIKQPRLGMHG